MRIRIVESKKANLLLEGRKDNAKAMIVKKIENPDLIKYLQGDIINVILNGDPTPNKKYIEWGARRMNFIAQREASERGFHDGNLDELRAKFEKDPKGYQYPDGTPYEDEKVLQVRGMMRSDRRAAGYLTNEEKYDSYLEDVKLNIANRANVIRRSLPTYHKLAEMNLIDKNIDSFKEIYEWEHSVYKAEQDFNERQEMKKREAGAKESTDYITDDDDYMMVRPRSEDASCYYGRGTKWCISAIKSKNWFDDYTGKNVAFYFVLFKHLPQDDNLKKLALVYEPDERYDDNMPSSVFDVADDDLGVDAIEEALRLNLLAKGAKLSIASQLKQIKGANRQTFFKDYFSTVVSQFEMALNGEYDATPGEREEDGEDFPEELKLTFNALGLDLDEDGWNVAVGYDLEEYLTEIRAEQFDEIIGLASNHLDANPAGPTDEDFDQLIEKYEYAYVQVSYDYMDDIQRYWSAYASFDLADLDEALEGIDDDEAEPVVRGLIENKGVYVDEIELYNGEVSLRFDPDYDEREGLEGFQNFLTRMDDVDQSLHDVVDRELADTLEAFQEAGLMYGVATKTLLKHFQDLDLTNFEAEIEDKEISIYKALDITVPMPPQLYRGLVGDEAPWSQQFRAQVSRSPALMAYEKMIKDNQTEHSDGLIKQIRAVFDRLFQALEAEVSNELPGLESGQTVDIETTGLLIPDYNVSIYSTSNKTQVGPSGLLMSYFFDVRIEADEEEQTSPENLKLIELFLRRIDSPEMLAKIRETLETIVSNDVVKNIIPNFKEGGEEPQLDPISGQITSKTEREAPGWDERTMEDELRKTIQDVMQENKRSITIKVKKKILNEATPFGGYPSGLAGQLGPNLGTTVMPHAPDEHQYLGDDTSQVAKAVIHRNGKVLLILNDKGWDLPGGHIRQAENVVGALVREIFEETGLTISERDITSMNMRHNHKTFFCTMLPHDDITLSDEHTEYGFYTLEEAMALENLTPEFKKAIKTCLEDRKGTVEYTGNMKIKIGGHAAAGMVPGAPK
jgi:ADP-ribose pyrophosphatase YjhB (NUDIX family)